MLQSGKLRFFLEGCEYVVEAGGIMVIPPGVVHRVEALEDSVANDVFAPRRDDWIRGDDAYLRR
jgi:quercetin dioxygenase-like cupin family protein